MPYLAEQNVPIFADMFEVHRTAGQVGMRGIANFDTRQMALRP